MITYTWKILELFAESKGVKYFVTANDGVNTVEHENNYTFPDGVVNLPFDQIKEQNLIDWLPKDDIKLILDNQLDALKNESKKIDFPWLADTFIPS
jgi:hypothetical protein